MYYEFLSRPAHLSRINRAQNDIDNFNGETDILVNY